MSSKRRILAKEKQRQALELRLGGATYEAIAERIGYSGKQGAAKAIKSALKSIIREPAEELLTMELERLDRMFLTHYKQCIDGDVRSGELALRISTRRCEMLGIDAPKKVAPTTPDGKSEWQLKLASVPDEKLEQIETMLREVMDQHEQEQKPAA